MTAARVVSLVPAITAVLGGLRPEVVVGATDRCLEPEDLETTRVRGPRNPDLAVIRDLAPDLVIASRQDNRDLDIRVLQAAGLRVWVVDAGRPSAPALPEWLLRDLLARAVPTPVATGGP